MEGENRFWGVGYQQLDHWGNIIEHRFCSPRFIIQSSESNRFYVSALSGGNTASIIQISALDSPFMSIQAVYVVLFAPRVDMICAEASSK